NGDVLQLRFEIDDVLDRNQNDPRTLGDRQETPRGCRQLVELRARQWLEPRYLLQRRQQSLHTHWLDQIGDPMDLEGRDRVLMVGSGEDEHGWQRELEQVSGELNAVHVRHVNVGEDEVGWRAAQQSERLAPASRLADDDERQRRCAVVEELSQSS